MASNDHSSRTDRCIAVAAKLPWWACLALAGFAYFALHALSLRPQTIVVDPGTVGAILGAFVLAGVLDTLQYAVPMLCVSSLFLSRLTDAMTAPQGEGPVPAAGHELSSWEFERLTAGGLRIPRARGKGMPATA